MNLDIYASDVFNDYHISVKFDFDQFQRYLVHLMTDCAVFWPSLQMMIMTGTLER